MAMDRDETRRAARAVCWRAAGAAPRVARCWRTAPSSAAAELPRDVPYGYHRWPRRRAAAAAGRPAALPTAPRVANLGLGGAAVRDALADELGDRRPGRPAAARRLVSRAGRRRAAGQPAGCRQPGAGSGAEPLLPELAPLPGPALPGGRERPRLPVPGLRAGAAGARRPGPERLVRDRPSGGSPAQAGGARATVARVAGGAHRAAPGGRTEAPRGPTSGAGASSPP